MEVIRLLSITTFLFSSKTFLRPNVSLLYLPFVLCQELLQITFARFFFFLTLFYLCYQNGPAQITRIPMNKYTLAKDNQKIYGSQCSMQLPGSAQHYRKESRFEIAMYLDIPDGKNCSDIPGNENTHV